MSQCINDDHAQHEYGAILDRQADEIDLLLQSTLCHRQCAEPAYDRIWLQLKERVEAHERQQAEVVQRVLAQQSEHRWRLRCQWHTIELDFSLRLSPLR